MRDLERRAAKERPGAALRVLVVDDDPAPRELVRRILVEHGHQVVVASNAADAAALLDEASCDLLISDLRMPGTDGLSLIRHARDNHPGVGAIMMTGYPSVATALEAGKLGADAYLEKPFVSGDLVDAVNACARQAAARRLGIPSAQEDRLRGGARWGMIGESPEMLRIFRMIRRVAPSDANVLLHGETGTGKELVARAIHHESRRSSASFKEINCAAVPDELLESELFGHVKGAFTGADRTRKGLFVAADGGTVFLDEIGDMSVRMQAALLRVLEEHHVKPVGTTRVQRIDVRLVTATNSDLREAMAAGRFREDLYYRIHGVRIELPALWARGNDIVLLARHFLDALAQEHGRPTPRFTDAAIDALLRYAWPGNVRELQHVVEQLALTCERNVIDVSDLPEEMRYRVQARSAHRTLREVKDAYIHQVLEKVNGNRTEAARILDVPQRTLRRWLNGKKEDET